MRYFLPWIGIILAIVALLFAVGAYWRHQRWRRREMALHGLLDGADRLEADIKKCRLRLAQAHAAVAVAPDVPAAGSAVAQGAIDRALRDLLAHRLWIRDHAADASQSELDAAVAALERAHAEIRRQLGTLGEAQRELDEAVREHGAS